MRQMLLRAGTAVPWLVRETPFRTLDSHFAILNTCSTRGVLATKVGYFGVKSTNVPL